MWFSKARIISNVGLTTSRRPANRGTKQRLDHPWDRSPLASGAIHSVYEFTHVWAISATDSWRIRQPSYTPIWWNLRRKRDNTALYAIAFVTSSTTAWYCVFRYTYARTVSLWAILPRLDTIISISSIPSRIMLRRVYRPFNQSLSEITSLLQALFQLTHTIYNHLSRMQ